MPAASSQQFSPSPLTFFGFKKRERGREIERRGKKIKESCQRVKARTLSPLLAIPRVTSLPVASPGNVSIRKLGRSVYVHVVVVVGICTLATVVPASCRDSLSERRGAERKKKEVVKTSESHDGRPAANFLQTSSSSFALNIVIKDRRRWSSIVRWNTVCIMTGLSVECLLP